MNSGGPDVGDLIVVEGASEEEVLQRSEMLALVLDPLVKNGDLAGYDLAARYLPSRKTQQARQASLPDRETLERNLTSAVQGLPFNFVLRPIHLYVLLHDTLHTL